MQKLTIEHKQTEMLPEGEGGRKSRVFSATLAGQVVANLLWNVPSRTEADRPVLTVLAGLETELNPVARNLLTGRRAVLSGGGSWEDIQRIEMLKSASYATSRDQACAADGSSGLALYLRELVVADPERISPDGVNALVLTPRWYSEQEAARLTHDHELVQDCLDHAERLGLLHEGENRLNLPRRFTADELVRLLPQAVRHGSFINRRTRRPLVARLEYYLQLYLAAVAWGVSSLPHTEGSLKRVGQPSATDPWWWARGKGAWQSFRATGMADCGLEMPVATHCTHDELDKFLTVQNRLYFTVQNERSATPATRPNIYLVRPLEAAVSPAAIAA